MSSDYLHNSIDSADIGIIRDVLRQSGFQYEEPMGELDRSAARYALDLYRQGKREPQDLIVALSNWARTVSEKQSGLDVPEVSL